MTFKAVGSDTEVVPKAIEKVDLNVEHNLITKMLIIVAHVFKWEAISTLLKSFVGATCK